jgi:hypothetical protein
VVRSVYMSQQIMGADLGEFGGRLMKFPSSPICLSALQRANMVTIVLLSSSYLAATELGKLNVLLALIQTIGLFGSTLLQNSVAKAAAVQSESGQSPLLASVFISTIIALTLAVFAQIALIVTLPADGSAIARFVVMTTVLSSTCALSPIATIYCVSVKKTRLASITAALSLLVAVIGNYLIDHAHATATQSVALLAIQPTCVVALATVLVCSHYSRHRVQNAGALGCLGVVRELCQNVPLLATGCLWVPVNVFLQSYYVQRMGLVGLGELAAGERLRQVVVFISSSMSAPLLIGLTNLSRGAIEVPGVKRINGVIALNLIMKSSLNYAVIPAIGTSLLLVVLAAVGAFRGYSSIGVQLSLIVSGVPIATNTLLGQYFVAQSVQWERAIADITLYCLLLAANLVLVPALGAMGAVVATFVAYSAVCLLLVSRIKYASKGATA